MLVYNAYLPNRAIFHIEPTSWIILETNLNEYFSLKPLIYPQLLDDRLQEAYLTAT